MLPISKVKSLFLASRPKKEETIQLATAVNIHLDREEVVSIRSVVDYYIGLRIWAYAYSIVGLAAVESKVAAGTRVAMANLS